MAVVFYVDPALAADHEHDKLKTITLSYTFYPVRDGAEAGCGARATSARETSNREAMPRDQIFGTNRGPPRAARNGESDNG